jgi:pyrroloquinoline-quinone synthase
MLNTGHATPEQIRGWVANRYYYQIAIPVKDAAIMANCPDREVRRGWVQRILDHDGFEYGLPNGEKFLDAGGIEAWIRLGEAVGLTRAEITDLRHVLPGVRFAVDAYVNFARRARGRRRCARPSPSCSPRPSTASASPPGPGTTRGSSPRACSISATAPARPRDVEQGLQVTLDHFRTRPMQERAVQILKFKLDILWSMNDVMGQHYGTQGVTAGAEADRKAA